MRVTKAWFPRSIEKGKVDRGPETVRIELLGRFRVSVGSRTVGEDGWRLKKARSLVKLLALTPDHRLHREQVMELLRLGSNPEAAANNLRQALYVARRVLDPDSKSGYLRLRDDWLELCPEGAPRVDVRAFEEAASMARRGRDPATYRVAIDLYAGDLLPHDRYEAWVEDRRAVLRRTYLDLLSRLGKIYEERGELQAAIEVLGEAVEAEPTHEEAHATLMRLYSASGRRHEAILQYERLRKVLSERLGVGPGEATHRLHEQIRAGRAEARSPTGDRGETAVTAEQPRRHNLPAERTSFVGREREMVEVGRLLSMTRLLTLSGAGGAGKTRFALALARNLVGMYPDGVWLAELAPLSEGELVTQAVAAALGVPERPGRPLRSTLKDFLSSKNLLLVLDNCEHVIWHTARLVEALLDTCPGLRVLATSREALNLAGEVVWSVSPLSVPDPAKAPLVEGLAGYESVRLFAERARNRVPAFALSEENVRTVAEICRQLDGIPLAIELAAAKVGALSVEQISERLEGSLRLLSGGSRAASQRQQTLAGALDWSHGLLTVSERDLFARLSVFAGGWTLEAAEAVGAGDGIEEGEVVEILLRLVDKSLVVAEAYGEGEPRHRMLEPVRQYGRERLEEGGEAGRTRQRHAAYYLALAEEAEPKFRGVDQQVWVERLERERGNLRAALGWALEQEEAEPSLRLSGALGGFWNLCGHLGEGRRWLEAALAKRGGPGPARARALIQTGWIAWSQGDYELSLVLYEECLRLSREIGDGTGVAAALHALGWAALFRNEPVQASLMIEEAIAIQREANDRASIAHSLSTLGMAAVVQRDHVRAAALHEEALALARKEGNGLVILFSLLVGALAYLGRGELRRARELCEEGLELSLRLRIVHLISAHLCASAALDGVRSRPARAARLWGAAEASREAIDTVLSPAERALYGPYIEIARAELDEAAWEAAWSEGKHLTLEQAVEYAISDEGPIQGQMPTENEPAGTLTPREREIAALLARELTNRQIAQELTISERTVTTHVHRILKKLGLRSRTHIPAWAMDRRLIQ